MGLSYQPKAITLSFKEGKPVTYKAQQVTYPTIKSKDLLAYAANAANEPQREAGGAVRASIRRLPRTPTRWVRNPLANAIRLRGTIDKMKALLKQKDNNPQG